jgi:hypothetical protein
VTDEHVALALNLSKIIGTALSGAFGLLGLLTDYRDQVTKRITRWGKIAFFGIVISTVVALVSQSLESAKQTRDAKAAAAVSEKQIEKSDAILHAVDRTIDPLTDIYVTSWLTVPLDDPVMSAYKQRLLDGVRQIVEGAKEHHPNSRLGYASRLKSDGTVEAVRIPADSPLFPERSDTVAFSGLHLQFFTPPQKPSAFQTTDVRKVPVPNLDMQVGSYLGPLDSSNSYALEYDLIKKQLNIESFNMPSDAKEWHSDGKIVSIFDLSGVQLAIFVDNTMGPPPPQPGQAAVAQGEISRLRAKMELGSVIFQVKNRRFWLNKTGLPRSRGGLLMQRVDRGSMQSVLSTLYLATLPDDLNTLLMQ